jgi:hypothetical protein
MAGFVLAICGNPAGNLEQTTMANNNFPYTDLLKTFQYADDAWSAELHKVFGKDAGQARYEGRGKGEEGSKLRYLHDARETAREAWYRSAYSA